MASETVLTETQAPEVLRLPYQKDYGLNPYTCTSFTNRRIFSLLYEPLYAMDSQYIAQPVLAADTRSPRTASPPPSPSPRRQVSLRCIAYRRGRGLLLHPGAGQ